MHLQGGQAELSRFRRSEQTCHGCMGVVSSDPKAKARGPVLGPHGDEAASGPAASDGWVIEHDSCLNAECRLGGVSRTLVDGGSGASPWGGQLLPPAHGQGPAWDHEVAEATSCLQGEDAILGGEGGCGKVPGPGRRLT